MNNRRQFLKGTLATLSAGVTSLLPASSKANTAKSIFLVPGYRPWQARYAGRALPEVPKFTKGLPKNYRGPLTLVTRVAAGAMTKRAVLPLRGYKIMIGGPDKLALCNAIRSRDYCLFDPATLEIGKIFEAHGDDFLGAGHSLFDDKQNILVATQMRRPQPAGAALNKHFGSLAVRDAKTFKVLENYSCHGIVPHDLAYLDNGRLVAIANYGSSNWNQRNRGEVPNAAEPSITVLELSSGKLVHKAVGVVGIYEIRHLAAVTTDRLIAIQTRLVSQRAAKKLMPGGQVYAADETTKKGMFFAPAPLLSVALGQSSGSALPVTPAQSSRQGQSIVYDRENKQLIVTFASAHAVAVFDMATGNLVNLTRTDRMGLFYPRGLALLHDGRSYAVSGSYRGLFIFLRGSHTPQPNATIHETFFHHSHLTVI